MSDELKLLEVAKLVAKAAHAEQRDEAGLPYFTHVDTVASMVDGTKEKIVAYLHDTLEDTAITKEDLLPVFGEEITEAVLAMSRRDGEDYFDFIRRAKQNPLARKVKIADLTHNSDPSRTAVMTEKKRQRLEKYQKAKEILLEEGKEKNMSKEKYDIENYVYSCETGSLYRQSKEFDPRTTEGYERYAGNSKWVPVDPDKMFDIAMRVDNFGYVQDEAHFNRLVVKHDR